MPLSGALHGQILWGWQVANISWANIEALFLSPKNHSKFVLSKRSLPSVEDTMEG